MAWSRIGKFEWPIAWALLTGVPNFARRGEDNTFRDVRASRGDITGAYFFGETSRYIYLNSSGVYVLGVPGVPGGEAVILHTGNANLAAKLDNSGTTVPFTGSIQFQGPGAAIWFNDRTSGRKWAIYGISDMVQFWNGFQNLLSMGADGTLLKGSGRMIVGGAGGGSGATSFGTAFGYLDIGPQNSTYCHFYTDRPRYYMNKPLEVEGGIAHYGGPRVPRTFVQATDPGAAAEPGDIWVVPL